MSKVDYFESRYLTLVGHVQSGKTIEEINYCYESIHTHHVPVVFIVRNVTADQLQLRDRFSENFKMKIKLLNTLNIDDCVKFMETRGVVILLCNEYQLRKMRNVIVKFAKPFHLCIDEVDFSIKSKDLNSILDIHLTFIKKQAKHILGATATPFALFSSEKSLNQIKYIKPSKRYHGIEKLDINFVDSCIIRKEDDFPLCDMAAMDTIYESFMEKSRGVILHTVCKEKSNHIKIQNYLSSLYDLTAIVYNGDGIRLICKNRNDAPFADKKELNKYNQLINKYSQIHEHGITVHYFQNYSISEVLQLLVDDPHHTHTHISIIAGHLASRGISFVSTDYSLHLTDQYFYAAKNTHGENLLQSLRILGCYDGYNKLALWCSEKTWKAINAQNKIINNLVQGVNNSMNWITKIKEIQINRPTNPLTRPRLCNYNIKPQEESFVLDIYYPSDQSEEN
jgi:hypothetical protein